VELVRQSWERERKRKRKRAEEETNLSYVRHEHIHGLLTPTGQQRSMYVSTRCSDESTRRHRHTARPSGIVSTPTGGQLSPEVRGSSNFGPLSGPDFLNKSGCRTFHRTDIYPPTPKRTFSCRMVKTFSRHIFIARVKTELINIAYTRRAVNAKWA